MPCPAQVLSTTATGEMTPLRCQGGDSLGSFSSSSESLDLCASQFLVLELNSLGFRTSVSLSTDVKDRSGFLVANMMDALPPLTKMPTDASELWSTLNGVNLLL
jgi:hypothetical protein